LRTIFRKPFKKPAPKVKTNEWIKAPKVRVIDETGKNLGILETDKAIALARERGLDLVLIAENQKETITKITNLGKYIYQLQKQSKKQREKQRKDVLKTIRLKLMTQAHDLETKARQIQKFLAEGHRVQVEIFLRGRERTRSLEAQKKLKEFIESLGAEIKILQERKDPRGPQIIITKS
jgi:translation initiation factor IF-3